MAKRQYVHIIGSEMVVKLPKAYRRLKCGNRIELDKTLYMVLEVHDTIADRKVYVGRAQ